MATNNIFTVAGTGTSGFAGDNGPATSAQLQLPTAVASTTDGGFLITDGGNMVVRRVGSDGTITTVAGTPGSDGFSGDGGPATSAQLNTPDDVIVVADGGFMVVDHANHIIRRVAPDGTITTVAGTPGTAGFSGDGGAATQAALNDPVSVASTADGGFLISDTANQVVRRVAADGTIATVAGTPGTAGFIGDGGLAVDAQLDHPDVVATTADGGFLIADANNNLVRRVAADGRIDTVAGNASAGFSGDGGPAISAQLNHPVGVVPTPDAGFLVADRDNNRIRRVSPLGNITTVAGNGTLGSSGDGGLATLAELASPVGVAVTGDGGILIVTINDSRVRLVDAGL